MTIAAADQKLELDEFNVVNRARLNGGGPSDELKAELNKVTKERKKDVDKERTLFEERFNEKDNLVFKQEQKLRQQQVMISLCIQQQAMLCNQRDAERCRRQELELMLRNQKLQDQWSTCPNGLYVADVPTPQFFMHISVTLLTFILMHTCTCISYMTKTSEHLQADIY